MKKNLILTGIIGIVLLAFFAGKESSKLKKIVLTEKAPKPIGPYSQAIITEDFVFVSGQIAINPKTNMLDTSSIEVETRQVMENIQAVLNASGLTMKNIVKGSIFLTDLDKFSQMNEVYGSYFKESTAAREAIQVVALPKGAHIEISVIAVK